MTVSLLPSFLSAGYSDTLAVMREAVEAAVGAVCFEEVARRLRPEIELQGACRWLRRRVQRCTLAGELGAGLLGCPREELDAFDVRQRCPDVRHLPTPLGLAHRPLRAWRGSSREQQPMGPDPPR